MGLIDLSIFKFALVVVKVDWRKVKQNTMGCFEKQNK